MEEKPINLNRKEPIPGEYGHPIPRELMLRELGYTGQFGRHSVGKRIVSQTFSTKAVYTMSTQEEFKKRSFKLPTGARTTFHMAFSADGTKVASCHGDHNVYVCDVGSGKVVQTLTGHPRTPWCVVFHPTQNDVLASGCLAGQVRVWDLNGGSETLVTDSGTVIASLAFHPCVRLLAIATFNEIIFWDWGLPYPLARCCTENTKEKVRLVRFDRLGRNLITGITNYPNPPFRESCRVQGSAFFRPNILSRSTNRTTRRPTPFPDDELDNAADDESEPGDNHGPTADESMAMAAAGQPSLAEALNDRQERFQESYRQLVNHYTDLVNHYQQFLRSRIPRLLESSRVVREQPQLVRMQASDFLPVVAVSEDASMESSPEASNDAADTSTHINVEPSDPLSLEEREYSAADSLELLPDAIVIDQEIPGPSRLMQLENTLLEHMETEAATTLANLPNLMANSTTPTPSTSQSANLTRTDTNLPRRDTDLQSIEALAQNILEMQNLCTQARRDAPLTVETQHIIELQNIRHHLELLQEQTRDLQSSIRATLTSLAHGSFDALRSHIVSNVAAATGVPNPQAAQPTTEPVVNQSLPPVDVTQESHPPVAAPVEPGPGPLGNSAAPMDIEMHMHMPPTHNQPLMSPSAVNQTFATATANAMASVHAHNMVTGTNPTTNPVIRITISPHITTANNPVELGRLSPPGPYVYSNSPPPSRSRVPPIVTMQYDFGDGMYRSRTTTLNPGINMEPAPGPSREIPGTSTTYQVARSTVDPITGNRRVVREFHVMGRPAPGENEHARNCPFGRDGNLARPPPRMRCLSEMGETPVLSVWPTTETGQEQATRSFQGLTRGDNAENGRSITAAGSTNQNDRTGNGYGTSNNGNTGGDSTPFYQMHPLYSSTHLPSFSHWMNSGPYWVNSDVGVGVYLTVRQLNEAAHMENEQLGHEDWQRYFVSGLGLVPPAVRQGQRHHSRRQRRTPNIIYHMGNGSSRAVPLRPSSWDEFRSNLYTSSSPTELGSLSPNSPYLAGINSARDVPPSLEGNFNRIYSMRMGDEIIPVYSHWAAPAPPPGGVPGPIELRESPQSNVYTFPIGLFLEGSFWTGGTQSIGIFWPPASREEEDSLIEFRRTETLVPVMTHEEMEIRSIENRSSVPYRIDFDSTRLLIHVSAELRLTLIQPGLTLLDATTTMVNWQRPRRSSGTVYVNQLAPFFESLERLFGHRMRRTVLPNPTGPPGVPNVPGHYHPMGNATVRLSTVMQPGGPLGRQFLRGSQGSSRQPRQEGNSATEPTPSTSDTNATDGAVGSARRERGRANHPRRFISFANEIPLYQSNILSRYPGETLEAYRRRLYHDYLGQEAPEGGPVTAAPGAVAPDQPNQPPQPLTHFISVSRNRLGRMTRNDAEQRFTDYVTDQPEVPTEHGTNSSSTRRFIRLAVDTATAEVLRRHQASAGQGHGNIHGGVIPSVQSAIESRIERVLNERGNRGMAPISPTNFAPDPNGARHRPEELQMRINVLTQWSRHRAAMSNSGTQTPRSFLRGSTSGEASTAAATTSGATEGPSPITTPATPAMQVPTVLNTSMNSPARPASRRRPYSRLSSSRTGSSSLSENNSDDESTPPLPPRIARMSLMPGDRTENSITGTSFPIPTPNNMASIGEEIALNSNEEGLGVNATVHTPVPVTSTAGSTSVYMPFGEHWVIRRQRLLNTERNPPRPVNNDPSQPVRPVVVTPETSQLRIAARRIEQLSEANPQGGLPLPVYNLTESSARTRAVPSAGSSTNPGPTVEDDNMPSTSTTHPRQLPPLRRNLLNNPNTNNAEEVPAPQLDASARFYPGYIPEILITPRARPPTYYTMDAATTAFLSSRIQKWDFSKFVLPDITKRDESVVVRECSLHSDACLDVSSDSDFLAVLQPSDNGQYSAVGLYSLQDESLGGILYIYHFDQNTVSVSISPSCDYIVVGYAGRGPFYRFVHPSRNIGQILSLTRDGERMKLVSVKELFADSQSSLMSINCMHWVPVPGYGIIYGTNTGELVLLS